jgi:transcriptional regulator with XRE-family HTH domain
MLNIFNFMLSPLMRLEEIGHEIRRSRLARSLTQAQLAAAAGVTRTTLNQLENGLLKELGIRKVEALLERLGLRLLVDQATQPHPSDFLGLAVRLPALASRPY